MSRVNINIIPMRRPVADEDVLCFVTRAFLPCGHVLSSGHVSGTRACLPTGHVSMSP